jgi:hypothetical protein
LRGNGGEKLDLGNFLRDLKMAFFETEISRQTATAADSPNLGASGLQKGLVRTPAHNGVVVAMWLSKPRDPLQVWGLPTRGAEEYFCECKCRARDLLGRLDVGAAT